MNTNPTASLLAGALVAKVELLSLIGRPRRWATSLAPAVVVAALLFLGTPCAIGQGNPATPNGGYIYFSLASGASTAPITLPMNVPWHVTGATTTANLQDQGVGFVELIGFPNSGLPNILDWTGLNEPDSPGVVSGVSTSVASTQIVAIDLSGGVTLEANTSNNSFVVTNNSPAAQTGYVTWIGFSNAILKSANTALGVNALGEQISNPSYTGLNNSATGFAAMGSNTTGSNNTATGYEAFYGNVEGNNNTAVGYQALYDVANGNGNIAVGFKAGYYVKDGYNIDIGNTGVSSDSKTIKIGTEGTQLNTYIAGIYDVTSLTGGLAVFVDSTGHLGTASSSERFKADIASMGSSTEKLRQLRPVTFHYKADPQGTLRYGLIAEEVATVYPELVVRDLNGRIDGVRYDELAPMLLNEMQLQAAKIAEEHTTVATLGLQHEADAAKIASLERQLAGIQAALVNLQTKDELVAKR